MVKRRCQTTPGAEIRRSAKRAETHSCNPPRLSTAAWREQSLARRAPTRRPSAGCAPVKPELEYTLHELALDELERSRDETKPR